MVHYCFHRKTVPIRYCGTESCIRILHVNLCIVQMSPAIIGAFTGAWRAERSEHAREYMEFFCNANMHLHA